MRGIRGTLTAAGKQTFKKPHDPLKPPKTLQLSSLSASNVPLSDFLCSASKGVKESLSGSRHVAFPKGKMGHCFMLQKRMRRRRDTYSGTAGSPLALLARTLALGEGTLQKTQGGKSQTGRSGTSNQKCMDSLMTHPFICQRRLRRRKHRV